MLGDTQILLSAQRVDKLPHHVWQGDIQADLGSIETWDLSNNNMCDSVLEYIIDKTKRVKVDSIKKIDLSHNLLSQRVLPHLSLWMHQFPGAVFDISYNSMVPDDLNGVPPLLRNRLKMVHECDKTIRLNAIQCKLSEISSWKLIETTSLEEELTRSVKNFYLETYPKVEILPVKKIRDESGSTLAEFDGIVVAYFPEVDSGVLAVVEAKHRVIEDDIADRLESIERLKEFLALIPEEVTIHNSRQTLYNLLRPYKNFRIVNFIGGVQVDPSAKKKALKCGFHVLEKSGTNYGVTFSQAPVHT